MNRSLLSTDEIQDKLLQIEIYFEEIKKKWDTEHPTINRWWSWTVWRSNLMSVTMFLLNTLDGLIQLVENLIPDGLDKKEAVMAVIEKVFDYIAEQAFPFWLRPFTKIIKQIVINIIIDNTIDFIVDKYNSGIWKMA